MAERIEPNPSLLPVDTSYVQTETQIEEFLNRATMAQLNEFLEHATLKQFHDFQNHASLEQLEFGVSFLRAKLRRKRREQKVRERDPRKRQSVYNRLRDFLSAIPAEQKQLALGFTEIGKIMGRPLPKTAVKDRTWWGNVSTEKTISPWVDAGWEVDQVYLAAQTVVFRRKGRNPLQEISIYLHSLLEGSRYRGRPDTHTLVEWIAFCRRVGWYFEGMALYEKGGLEIGSLDEAQHVTVEEDYLVCKRELNRYKSQEVATSARK